MDKGAALEELTDLVAASKYPKLSDPQVRRLLEAHIRVVVFTPGAFYETGQKVIAPGADITASGVPCYLVTSGGTAGQSAPVFPSALGLDCASGSLTLRLLGSYNGCQWDLKGAANKGWKMKAAAVAGNFDFKDAGQTLSRGQVHANCLTMAKEFVGEWTV